MKVCGGVTAYMLTIRSSLRYCQMSGIHPLENGNVHSTYRPQNTRWSPRCFGLSGAVRGSWLNR